MIKIRQASLSDIPSIQGMAQVVFRRTYAKILSPEQMEFMLDWMYSQKSLEEQIAGQGKCFFLAEDEKGPCGYVSYEFQEILEDGRKLFHLQKIYVMPDRQGEGLGRKLFEHVITRLMTLESSPFRVELNVNRDNVAVSFYERMGMIRAREGDFPIGHGFYMNDYIYALDCCPAAAR